MGGQASRAAIHHARPGRVAYQDRAETSHYHDMKIPIYGYAVSVLTGSRPCPAKTFLATNVAFRARGMPQ
jgi:hypothetical protein